VDLAFFREVTGYEKLGTGRSTERAEALIEMLKYNYPARAHGPGWIKNRNEDIKYIQEKYL
jgi:hypothetical protein